MVSVRAVFVASFHVMVTVAVLSSDVFFFAVRLIVPSFAPLAGVAVSQPSPPVTATVHEVLLLTMTLCVFPSALNCMEFVLMDR